MNYFLLELFLGIGVMLLPFLGVVIWRKMPVFQRFRHSIWKCRAELV